MRLHDTCLALGSIIRDLQEAHPEYKIHGEPFPEFKSSWDDRLWSMIHTRPGTLMERVTNQRSEKSLTGKFMTVLENRFIPRNYQQTVDTLEKIIDSDPSERGEERIISCAAQDNRVGVWGSEFVPMLQKAGITFSNPDRFGRLMKKAQEFGIKMRRKQKFDL